MVVEGVGGGEETLFGLGCAWTCEGDGGGRGPGGTGDGVAGWSWLDGFRGDIGRGAGCAPGVP